MQIYYRDNFVHATLYVHTFVLCVSISMHVGDIRLVKFCINTLGVLNTESHTYTSNAH
jgi:hypothetical protein